MLIYGLTDIGMVRKENQDFYAIRTDFPSGHAVGVVCDGMGGPAGGERASKIAVATYMERLESLLQADMTTEELELASAEAVLTANRAVWSEAQKLGYQSMGTTLVSAILSGADALITNVGDSRAYYAVRGNIDCVTRDHSLVQDMVERGEITEEEARYHPKRNLITRALGPDENVRCDTYFRHMEPQSSLLLCSDGLVNTLADGEILTVLENNPPNRCPERLISVSKRRGAPDNVTVVLIRNSAEGGATL